MTRGHECPRAVQEEAGLGASEGGNLSRLDVPISKGCSAHLTGHFLELVLELALGCGPATLSNLGCWAPICVRIKGPDHVHACGSQTLVGGAGVHVCALQMRRQVGWGHCDCFPSLVHQVRNLRSEVPTHPEKHTKDQKVRALLAGMVAAFLSFSCNPDNTSKVTIIL